MTEPHAEDLLSELAAETNGAHPLQKAFGLSEQEFELLLGDGSDERRIQLAELSQTLVGHLAPNKRAAFLRSEVPMESAHPDHPECVRRHIPLEVSTEPDGLERVIRAVRIEAARLIAKKCDEDAVAPVPESKKKLT